MRLVWMTVLVVGLALPNIALSQGSVKPAYTQKEISACLRKNTYTIRSAHPKKVLLPSLIKILTGLIGRPKTRKDRNRIKYLAAAMTTSIYFSLVGRRWSKFRKLAQKPFDKRVFELKKSAGLTQKLRGEGAFGTNNSSRLSFTAVYRFASATSKHSPLDDRYMYKASQFDLNRVNGFDRAFSSPVGPRQKCEVFTHIYVNRKLPFRIHLLMTVMHRGYLMSIKVFNTVFKFFVFRNLSTSEIKVAFRNKAFIKRLKTVFGGKVNLKTQRGTALNFLKEYALTHGGFVMVGKGRILLNQTGITKKRYMGLSLNYIANNKMLRSYTLAGARNSLRSVLSTRQ